MMLEVGRMFLSWGRGTEGWGAFGLLDVLFPLSVGGNNMWGFTL